LTFPEKNQEMDSNASSVIGIGISEIEEEKDGEDEPENIIMVSSMSNLTSFLFSLRSHRVIGQCLD
jgi:hypothetical protein